jgi:hypothetical protein
MLTREQILAADDRKSEMVDVPEWGGQVRVRTFSGADRDRVEAFIASHKDGSPVGFRALLVSLAVCDEAGARLFAPADVDALGEKSGVAIDRVFTAAAKLNGILADSGEKAKESFG